MANNQIDLTDNGDAKSTNTQAAKLPLKVKTTQKPVAGKKLKVISQQKTKEMESRCLNPNCDSESILKTASIRTAPILIQEPVVIAEPILVNGYTSIFKVDGKHAALKKDGTKEDLSKQIYRVIPKSHAHIINYVIIDDDGDILKKLKDNHPVTVKRLLESQRTTADELLKRLMSNGKKKTFIAASGVQGKSGNGSPGGVKSPAESPVIKPILVGAPKVIHQSSTVTPIITSVASGAAAIPALSGKPVKSIPILRDVSLKPRLRRVNPVEIEKSSSPLASAVPATPAIRKSSPAVSGKSLPAVSAKLSSPAVSGKLSSPAVSGKLSSLAAGGTSASAEKLLPVVYKPSAKKKITVGSIASPVMTRNTSAAAADKTPNIADSTQSSHATTTPIVEISAIEKLQADLVKLRETVAELTKRDTPAPAKKPAGPPVKRRRVL